MVVTLLQLVLANFTPTTLPMYKDDDESKPETTEELQAVMIDLSREKEILGKAIGGILVLMLKWFHASRNSGTSSLSDPRCPQIRISQSTPL